MSKMLNGINIDQLVATVNAITENPDIARFKFRSDTEWINGGHSRSNIQGFLGLAPRMNLVRNHSFRKGLPVSVTMKE